MTDPDLTSVKADDSGKELSFITVIGQDRKGIVARVSTLLYEHEINIEDIAQKVMHGQFVMIMLVDFRDSPSDLEDVKAGLDRIAAELELRIQIQHEDLFKMMHRV
ncbi:MAG: ACT domain-containing protein [Candidatus Glassbacteria bacterium]|nr:ACT domain-containing protein [Candidatus Glassbacteria bacterium]